MQSKICGPATHRKHADSVANQGRNELSDLKHTCGRIENRSRFWYREGDNLGSSPVHKLRENCDAPRNAQGLPLDYIRNGYILARMGKSEPHLPLTPAVFHILLALFGQERHGYDIMQKVKSDSQGAVKMGPGTLYGSLDRMIEAGLVTQGNTQDSRRIYYKLTAVGQATLRAETDRLSRLAAVARRQLGTA